MAASVAESSLKTVQLTGQACRGTIETGTGPPHPRPDEGDASLSERITFFVFSQHIPYTQQRGRSCDLAMRCLP